MFGIVAAAIVGSAVLAMPDARAERNDLAAAQTVTPVSFDFRGNTRSAVSTLLLDSHNRERERLGLPSLSWDPKLEAEAARWAKTLSRKGYLEHSDHRARGGAGENLWMGTAGYWDVDSMFDGFLEERRHYRHGAFPHVSRTGDWSDVGHYTQIIWRETRQVGCAVVTGRGNDVLVCRYWPAGNVWGARAY